MSFVLEQEGDLISKLRLFSGVPAGAAKLSELLPLTPGWMVRVVPHNYVRPGNPLFGYEARGLSYGRTNNDLIERTYRRLGFILGIGLVFWVFMLLGLILSNGSSAWYNTLWDLIQFAFVISLLDKFLLDFVGVFAGLNSVNRDRSEGRWDLICITGMSVHRMIRAKHAVIQIKSWRTMTNVMGLRLTVVVLALLTWIVPPLIFPHAWYMSRIEPVYGPSLIYEIVATSMLFLTLGSLMLAYIIEPRWRLRALTAGSLAVSARLRDGIIALMGAFGVFIGIWLAQIALSVFGVFLIYFTAMMGLYNGTLEILVFLVFPVLIACVYFTYDALATMWLNRAYLRLVQLGGET